MRRVSVAGISGSGKTTFSRKLAAILDVQWFELDALHHGPNWTEASAEQLAATVTAAIEAAPGGWVIDGNYRNKLGDLVLEHADTFVWLEPPLRVSLGRLVRRTWTRWRRQEPLWNDNRESLRGALHPRWGLFSWAVQAYVRHKREIPAALARNPHVRLVHLRTPRDVGEFLNRTSSGTTYR